MRDQGPRRMISIRNYCCTGLMMLAATTMAHAVEPAALIDADLKRHAVKFVTLGDGVLTYFDNNRRLQRQQADRFVTLTFQRELSDQALSLTGASMVQLGDGQVFRGEPAGVDEQGRLQWETEHFGVMTFKLDDVARVTTTDQPPALPLEHQKTTADDRVVLTNGDVVSGFVAALKNDGLVLQVEQQELTLGWDRVAQIILPNPIRRSPGVWARLVDGSQVRIDEPAMDSSALAGQVAGRAIRLPHDRVHALEFATQHQLVRLGQLEPTRRSGGEVFGVPMPPKRAGEQLALHAPVTIEYQLPAGVKRFAASAALDPQGLDWADLNLVIADGRGELARHHLNADQPTVSINVELRDRKLILTLDEGLNGPVFDRLTLRDAYLLVETDR